MFYCDVCMNGLIPEIRCSRNGSNNKKKIVRLRIQMWT